jgi:hypothetical protein
MFYPADALGGWSYGCLRTAGALNQRLSAACIRHGWWIAASNSSVDGLGSG